MGNHKAKYHAKQHAQHVAKKENAEYYQNGSEQKHPRSDAERTKHRRLDS